MPVKTLKPGTNPFAPMSDISARIPPSPRLSARMTNTQYLIEMVTIKVHTISESTPSALCGVNCPPVACTTVCRVYSGLVPKSPNTTPSAAKLVQPGVDRSACRPGEPSLVVDLPCMPVNSQGPSPTLLVPGRCGEEM